MPSTTGSGTVLQTLASMLLPGQLLRQSGAWAYIGYDLGLRFAYSWLIYRPCPRNNQPLT